MKNLFIGISLMVTHGLCLGQSLPQLGKAPVEEVVAALTTEEKVDLLIGTGMPGMSGNSAVIGATQNLVPGAAGTTHPVERLGIPAIVVADGPAGLRISPTREGSPETFYCTAFPVATLLASTWNSELVEQVGTAMGNEVKEYGCDVLLAPALNIHRNPLCGRNFEYYSEDPYLTGRIATAMVKGIQSNGVGTSIKHFAVNNQETNRTGNDVHITPRTLREIYLRGFETVIKEAAPWTVMSSYNKINGTYASESRELLTTILRDEWGYKGLVMTDWFGGKNAPAQIHAGNDLLMPGRPDQKEAILKALADGSLSMEDVDTDVTRVLNLILLTPRFNGYAYSNRPDLKAHAEVTRHSASEGMVLLKNEGTTLPLPASVKNIAAYGTTSYDFIAGGTGSGDVNEAYTVSLVEGLEKAGYTLHPGVKSTYKKYLADERAKKPKDTNPMAAFLPHPRIPEFVPEAQALATEAGQADMAFITLGRNSGEFLDRTVEGDFNLTEQEQGLIRSVTEAYHKAGKKVVVILNIGGIIETASWKDRPDAILLAWQAGQEGGNSVADILSGKINPSGKLPMTFPTRITDVYSFRNFPDASSIDMKEMMMGFMGKAPARTDRKNVDYTKYEEGIYVGYRYFDTFGIPVSYPFGYGLSYTTFNYSDLQVFTGDRDFRIHCTVTNTSKVPGKEIAQLYISAPGQDMDKPSKELKGFLKTPLLQPGESYELNFRLNDSDLASFEENKQSWVIESGQYKVSIGPSSITLPLQENFQVKGRTVEKVNSVLELQEELKVLKKL